MWRPEVQHQVFAELLTPEAVRENLFRASLPAAGALLAISGVPCLADTSTQSLSSCSHGTHPVCISMSKFPFFIRTPAILDSPNSLIIEDDLILTNYICHDSISNKGHIRRSWDLGPQHMSIRGAQFDPYDLSYPVHNSQPPNPNESRSS